MVETRDTVPGVDEDDQVRRRDFLFIATTALAGAGTLAAIWPVIDQMNPAADVLALSSIEVDLSPVALGQRLTVTWRGKPVFIVHRTKAQIAEARADDNNPRLIDPQKDAARVEQPQWLVVIGVCTHLGCIPLGQKSGQPRGKWGGWFCPCHGSQYDISGRVRRGPAPRNLVVPPYKFLTDTKIKIG